MQQVDSVFQIAVEYSTFETSSKTWWWKNTKLLDDVILSLKETQFCVSANPISQRPSSARDQVTEKRKIDTQQNQRKQVFDT